MPRSQTDFTDAMFFRRLVKLIRLRSNSDPLTASLVRNVVKEDVTLRSWVEEYLDSDACEFEMVLEFYLTKG